MVLTLWLIAYDHIFLNAILPGTPYTNAEKLSPEQIALLNEQAGLDKPMITQYGLVVFKELTLSTISGPLLFLLGFYSS